MLCINLFKILLHFTLRCLTILAKAYTMAKTFVICQSNKKKMGRYKPIFFFKGKFKINRKEESLRYLP